jgi:predicted O-methyltransferase YrrM
VSQYTEALLADYEARARDWSDIQGHLPTLYDAVVSRPAARVLELGVRWGTSTASLLAAVDQVGGHLWSVDIAEPRVPDWWANSGLWTLLVGDDLSAEILAAVPEQVDMLFLDTSHDYGHTLAELRAYVPRVAPGGLVCCHDTELQAPEGVQPQEAFPVARALDAFCAETGLQWTNNPGSYGLGVIRVPG